MTTKRFKYVQTFTDKRGFVRTYLRRKGMKPIPLPGAVGSREFVIAYEAALAEASPEWPASRPADRPADVVPGVYILLRGGEVSYVGTSADVHKRVSNHRTNGRQFDTYYVIPAPEDERVALESALLRALRVGENRNRTGIIKGQKVSTNRRRISAARQTPPQPPE